MSIIYQITALVILLVGLFALLHKSYPKLKEWFTNGKVNYLWLVLITVGIFIFLTYPYFFNLWAVYFWHVPTSELTDYTKLGPLGDIYGSLNTLFTSATLAIVIYSTILQRQANEDVRKAMYEELIQAKNLAEIQLGQSKQAALEQLDLVRETHAAQIRENQYSFFTNQFYALLNLKENKFYKLKVEIKNKYYEQDQIFVNLSAELTRILKELEGQELTLEYLEKNFLLYVDATKTDASDLIFSYFLIYTNLLKLIKNSCLEDYEKQIYYEVLSNSMRLPEQVVFFWVSCFIPRFRIFINNIMIFTQFYDDIYVEMAYKFHDRTCFPASWQKKFDEIDYSINHPT